ncbi:MAG: response regulator [Planctomycetes bacterium]|nr:response regulator [Planctomycetota bacterium]
MRALLDAPSFERRLRWTLGVPLVVLAVLSGVLLLEVLELRARAEEISGMNMAVVLVREAEGQFADLEAARGALRENPALPPDAYEEAARNLDATLGELSDAVRREPRWRTQHEGLAADLAQWRALAERDLGRHASAPTGAAAVGANGADRDARGAAARLRSDFVAWTNDIRAARTAVEQPTRARAARVLVGAAILFPLVFGVTAFVARRSARRLATQYRQAWNDLERQSELLAAANTRFEIAVGQSGAVVYEWDVARDLAVLTGRTLEVMGHAQDAGPVSFAWWQERLHEDDRPRVLDTFQSALETCGRFAADYRFRRPDGSWAEHVNRGVFVPGPEGRPERIVGLIQDVTEQRELTRQLEKAGRLESLGRLAGGVAHDFNNITTAILGFSELAARPGAPPAEVREALAAIRRAGERAAGITSGLLSFARSDVLASSVLELDAQVREALPLLRRAAGDGVQVDVLFGAPGAQVRMDAARLESALVNLVLNARDAMPNGGRCTIETALADDGAARRQVLLRVSDEGAGMTAEVKARVFEPFFTTKPRGQGTGLGLPSVHGAVTQAGGAITVESEPGRGTRFEIRLPLAEAEQAARAPLALAARPGGAETILLVEDDHDVRALATQMLRRAGYRVIECASGADALRRVAESADAPDLLLSDVVMPEMSGPQVAEALTGLRPGLRVLYMSGYAEDLMGRNGVLQPGAQLVAKPFTPRTLLAGVRAALDGVPVT